MEIASFSTSCSRQIVDSRLSLSPDIQDWLSQATINLENLSKECHYLTIIDPNKSVSEIMMEYHLSNLSRFDRDFSPENIPFYLVGFINYAPSNISEILTTILDNDISSIVKIRAFSLFISGALTLDDDEFVSTEEYLKNIMSKRKVFDTQRHIFIDPKDPHKVFAVDEMQYIYIKVCRYLSTILFKSLG